MVACPNPRGFDCCQIGHDHAHIGFKATHSAASPEKRGGRVADEDFAAHPCGTHRPIQAQFLRLELTRNVGIGSSARELSKLEDSGLLMTRRIGNQKALSSERHFALFSDVRNIVLKTVGLAEPLGSVNN